jgi:hypothetical protein
MICFCNYSQSHSYYMAYTSGRQAGKYSTTFLEIYRATAKCKLTDMKTLYPKFYAKDRDISFSKVENKTENHSRSPQFLLQRTHLILL